MRKEIINLCLKLIRRESNKHMNTEAGITKEMFNALDAAKKALEHLSTFF